MAARTADKDALAALAATVGNAEDAVEICIVLALPPRNEPVFAKW